MTQGEQTARTRPGKSPADDSARRMRAIAAESTAADGQA